jgi:lipoyl synthase
MKQLFPENVWQMDEKELLKVLDTGLLIPRRKKIRFYAPSFMYYKTSSFCSSPTDFPTISVTGRTCALKCKHCGGIVLDTMHPAITPEKLLELCKGLKQKGASGCLISGGCLPDGSVPLAKFVDAIAEIKRDLDLTVFVHTGIINVDAACSLRKAGVDVALIDIIGSDETIREIYNMNVTVQDYANSLKALDDSSIPFVPHVVVGLHYGRLKGEWNALKMIAERKPSALVIIAFMPIHKTEMQNIKPPKPLDIARVTATARLMFPRTPLVLGCMRPKGETQTETDILAIKAGVDAIAFPVEEAVKYAETHGYDVAYSSFCCAQIYAYSKNLGVPGK